MSLVIKIATGSDIRRFTISSSLTWAEFRDTISRLLVLPEGFSLKYTDEEGDLITMSNDSDYQEGLRVFRNSKAPIWKLAVSLPKADAPKAEAPKPAPEPAAEGFGPLFGMLAAQLNRPEVREVVTHLRDAFISQGGLGGLGGFGGFGGFPCRDWSSKCESKCEDGKKEEKKDEPFVHPAVCDACNKQIVGIRWKCETRFNTDLCNECMTKGESPLCKEKYTKLEKPARGGWRHGCHSAPRQAETVVVHPAFCDACEAQIVGIRWKCVDLEDTDLCNTCMEKGEHPLCKHDYVKIERVFCPRRAWKGFKKFGKCGRAGKAPEASPAPSPVIPKEEPKPVVAEPPAAKSEEKAPEPIASAPPAPAPEAPKADPADKFLDNVRILKEMGFVDVARNVQALAKAKGSLDRAIQYLLE